MSHLSRNNDHLVARVHRIGGQIGAVDRALQKGAPCAEVLHLVAAVRGAVNGLLDEIIADHLQKHVAAPGLDDEVRAAGAADLLAVIRRYTK